MHWVIAGFLIHHHIYQTHTPPHFLTLPPSRLSLLSGFSIGRSLLLPVSWRRVQWNCSVTLSSHAPCSHWMLVFPSCCFNRALVEYWTGQRGTGAGVGSREVYGGREQERIGVLFPSADQLRPSFQQCTIFLHFLECYVHR